MISGSSGPGCSGGDRVSRAGISLLLLLAPLAAFAEAPFRMPQCSMDCPPASLVAFDGRNRPYLTDTRDPKRYGTVLTLREGKWIERSFLPALKKAGFDATPNYDNPRDLGAMTFDGDDHLYLIVATPAPRRGGKPGEVDIDGNAALLYSTDYGETFTAYPLNARPYLCTMETANGGSALAHPPALVIGKALKYVRDVYVNVRGRKEKLRFCEHDRLGVIFPEKSDGGLKLPPPVVVTEKANGVTSHSGALNVAAGGPEKLYVAYIEVPDNLESGRNPVRVAEIDRTARKVTGRAHLLDSPPSEADCHSTPSLVVDGKGIIHVVTGSHAWKPDMEGFSYLHSVGDGIGKWSEPVLLGTMQTYVALTADEKGNLHLAYRHTPDLAYRRRDAASGKWSEQTVIAVPPRRDTYTCYYHHVFTDRKGSVYLEFSLDDHKGKKYPHMLAVSTDGGETWRAAATGIFRQNFIGKE